MLYRTTLPRLLKIWPNYGALDRHGGTCLQCLHSGAMPGLCSEFGAWGSRSVVEHLPSRHKTLGLMPSITKIRSTTASNNEGMFKSYTKMNISVNVKLIRIE